MTGGIVPSGIHMSGWKTRPQEEVEQQEFRNIPRFNCNLWRANLEFTLERRNIQRTENPLEDILRILTSNRYRRGPRRFFESNEQHYRQVIFRAIERGEPLEFILPSFPVKCFNPLKVRRRTPDLAEIGCLSKLYALCHDIQRVYSPGARVELITDGLVYAPIFQEPIELAQKYKEVLQEIINALDFSKQIGITDMSTLVERHREEYDFVAQKVRNTWNPAEHQELIINSMHNLNLMEYSEDELVIALLHNRPTAIRQEIQTRATTVSHEYVIFKQTIRAIQLLEREFPDAIRVTCHPKDGHLGLHLVHPSSFNFPWNGVGILRPDGTVRVESEYSARRNLNYRAVYIQGEEFPFFYEGRRNMTSLV